MRSPVLFIVFNRPDTTAQVFEAIRAARPPRLYVAADGPGPGSAGDEKRCAQARRIATSVDWPCEVMTLFQSRNLGPKLGPVAGISWFFREEPEGIILEDDILPLPSFFRYCDELLERYRDDERVGMICGSNRISSRFTAPNSYFFSRYLDVWGWAGWRRTWHGYDPYQRTWPAWRDGGGLARVSDGNPSFEAWWSRLYDAGFEGRADWWSYQLQYSCWSRDMLVAVPCSNQITNVGFAADSIHTRRQPAYLRESVAQPMAFPMRHPPEVARDAAADRVLGRLVHGLTPAGYVRRGAHSVKVFVRGLPVVGDLLKRAQVAIWSAAGLLAQRDLRRAAGRPGRRDLRPVIGRWGRRQPTGVKKTKVSGRSVST